MCLETWNHYRCGHIEYYDADPCPYLEEVHRLLQKRGKRHQDQRIDRLHQRCEEAQARRYFTPRSKCPRCDEYEERRDGAGAEPCDTDATEGMDGVTSYHKNEFVGDLRTMENEKQQLAEKERRSKEKEQGSGTVLGIDKEKQPLPISETNRATTPKGNAQPLSQSSDRRQDVDGNGSKASEMMQM